MIAPDRVVTFARPSGYRVVAELGVVYGEASRQRNLLRELWRLGGAIIGLNAIDFLSDAERARGECIEALRDRADAIGANGVIGVRFEATERTDGTTHVRAEGTAVVLEAEAP